MKTILLPVDFSEHTSPAYKFVVNLLGDKISVKLLFVHSYNDQILVTDTGIGGTFENDAFMNVQLIEEFKQQSEHNMQQLKSEVENYLTGQKLTNFTVETRVSGGDPEAEVEEVCSEVIPDLLVMGTQGQGKKGFLAGSMAKKIMNKVNIPVIAVPSVVKIKREFRIMYASNNNDRDFAKLQLLLKLFENINTKIFAVHFHYQGDTKNIGAAHIEELKEAFSMERLQEKINFSLIDTDDYEEAIDAFVSQYKINAVAFISHKKNFFSSLFSKKISKNDFFNLGLPMVALHE